MAMPGDDDAAPEEATPDDADEEAPPAASTGSTEPDLKRTSKLVAAEAKRARKRARRLAEAGRCVGAEGPCGSIDDVQLAGVRTLYPDTEQPNPRLCAPCRRAWHEYWDDMWSNVPGYGA